MTVTWIPKNGGYWINGHLVGEGDFIDENSFIILKGNFNSDGKLDDVNGEFIDFRDPSNVVIRVGVFASGVENGSITEYVFDKNNWESFKTSPAGVMSTKYERIYSNGSLVSTNSSIPKRLRGNAVSNGVFGNLTNIGVSEV